MQHAFLLTTLAASHIIRLNNHLIVKGKGVHIMKKSYAIEVDCAACANKMENAAGKLPGIKALTINYMAQKITVEYEEGADIADLQKQILKTCRKIESDCTIEF